MQFFTDTQGRKWLVAVTETGKIYIPGDVYGIVPSAFTMAMGVSEIHIPASVHEIGADTFGCFDERVTIYCQAQEKPEGWADSEQPLDSEQQTRAMLHNYWLGSAKFTFDGNGILTYLPLKYRSGAPKVVWGQE